jgi:DNA-binding NtrC family response regulator
MPGLRGPDLVRQLPYLTPDTPVLYISGNIDSTPLDDVLSEPTVALIHKPFTADALARQVRQMLDNRPVATPGRVDPLGRTFVPGTRPDNKRSLAGEGS